MAEIVNLRRVKKARARSAAAQQAEANRVFHGTSPAVRKAARAEQARSERTLDGAHLRPADADRE